jgi:hypothetical protein
MKKTTIAIVRMIISPKFVMNNEQTDNSPPIRYIVVASDTPTLAILKKALYMLRCLQYDESEQNIIQKSYSSSHPIRMWINVLLYGRRILTSKGVGITSSSSEYWTIMAKGRQRVNKMKRTNNDISRHLQ